MTNLITPLFEGLVILQFAALVFFGLAMLLRRWTAEPVERNSRHHDGVLCDSGAVRPCRDAVSAAMVDRPLARTAGCCTSPAPAETNQSRDGNGAVEVVKSVNSHQPLVDTRGSDSLADAVGSDSGGVIALMLLGLTAKSCVMIAFFAVSLVMIVMQCVALVRLRWIMRIR